MLTPGQKDHALEVIVSIAEKGKAFAQDAPRSREDLLELSRALTAALESPAEAVQRITIAEPIRTAHCKMAVDLKIFSDLARAGDGGITAHEMAVIGETDIGMMQRVLKHLAAMHVIRELRPGVFTSTPGSAGFAEPRHGESITFANDILGPVFTKLPDFLKKTRYQDPVLLPRGPFQYAHETPLPLSSWVASRPPYGTIYANLFAPSASTLSSPSRPPAAPLREPRWFSPGLYPVSTALGAGFDPTVSPLLFVDVRGGDGANILALQAAHPGLRGRFVLQDEEAVIAKVRAAEARRNAHPLSLSLFPSTTTTTTAAAAAIPAFEPMTRDLFRRQPDRHARAYFLGRGVLGRGRSDGQCVDILRQIAPAMRFGYSRLLVNEVVMPDPGRSGADWTRTASDWLALAVEAGKERSEARWRAMLEAAGLRVLDIYSRPLVAESVIEATLAAEEFEGGEGTKQVAFKDA